MYWMSPGSTIRSGGDGGGGGGGGSDGFLAEIGLVPAGEIGRMRRLERHYRIELAADGWDLLRHMLGIRRLDGLPFGHV